MQNRKSTSRMSGANGKAHPQRGKALWEFNTPLLFQGLKMASSLIPLNSSSPKERKESRQRKGNAGKNILSPHTGHPLTQKPDVHACVCVCTHARLCVCEHLEQESRNKLD